MDQPLDVGERPLAGGGLERHPERPQDRPAQEGHEEQGGRCNEQVRLQRPQALFEDRRGAYLIWHGPVLGGSGGQHGAFAVSMACWICPAS